VEAAVDEEDWSRREQSSNLSRQERPMLAVGSIAGSQQRPAGEDGEESRTWRHGGRLAEVSRAPPQVVAMVPSRWVLCLSISLLSVGGGADDLGVESTNPEKTLEEHDFNNFLNCPSFSRKKLN
jgi:hypothetical protein